MKILLRDDYSVTLEATVRAIARINRFQGRLRVSSWTVLHHSILCCDLAAKDYSDRPFSAYVRDVYFHALAHDLIEAMYGDTNGFMKTDEQRENEKRSAGLMLQSLGVEQPAGMVLQKIEEIDERALYAEAACFGDREDPQIQNLIVHASPEDVVVARHIKRVYDGTAMPNERLVADYLKEFLSLLEAVRG